MQGCTTMWERLFRSKRKITRIHSIILLIGSSLISFNTSALTSTEYSFDEQVEQSDLILVGTVGQIDSFWGQGRGADTIFSNIQLIDLEQIKGQHPDSDYNLRVIGGIIGDQAQLYPGLPQFVSGQRYLLFIKGNQRSMFPIIGAGQGFYRIQWDEQQQRQVAIPATSGSSLSLTRQAASRSVHQHDSASQDLETLVNQIRNSLIQNKSGQQQ